VHYGWKLERSQRDKMKTKVNLKKRKNIRTQQLII